MRYAKPALLLIRILDRIKRETILDEIHKSTTLIHSERRSEQVRLLRLFAEIYKWEAAAEHQSIPDELSTDLLEKALGRPGELHMHADHYLGKSILTNALASEQAKWQPDDETHTDSDSDSSSSRDSSDYDDHNMSGGRSGMANNPYAQNPTALEVNPHSPVARYL
ncbi:hypothetical protein JCM5353_003018 [Sporobolomyces roseus]